MTASLPLLSDGDVSFVVVDSDGLAPYIGGLRSLEQKIEYPIDDGKDFFCIDHGPLYHPFFSRMGKARFLVALQGSHVIGSMVGVWRTVDVQGRRFTGLYFCDLKLAPEWRKRGLVRRMLWALLRQWPFRRDFQGWNFVFFAAMRGERGDVGRSFRGWHLGKVVRPQSRLLLYFEPLERLCTLEGSGPILSEPQGVDLSPDKELLWESTDGCKEYRLRSTGQAWRLLHLPRSPRSVPSWGDYLRETAQSLVSERPGSLACFGLDERLGSHRLWLSQQGFHPGATCLVYAFSLPFWGPKFHKAPWLHLATSEI